MLSANSLFIRKFEVYLYHRIAQDCGYLKVLAIFEKKTEAILTDDIKPATFGILYDDLENPMKGGTGHTMHVCEQNRIPIIDQRTWLKWPKELRDITQVVMGIPKNELAIAIEKC